MYNNSLLCIILQKTVCISDYINESIGTPATQLKAEPNIGTPATQLKTEPILTGDPCDVSSLGFSLFKSVNGFNKIIIVLNSLINYSVVNIARKNIYVV